MSDAVGVEYAFEVDPFLKAVKNQLGVTINFVAVADEWLAGEAKQYRAGGYMDQGPDGRGGFGDFVGKLQDIVLGVIVAADLKGGVELDDNLIAAFKMEQKLRGSTVVGVGGLEAEPLAGLGARVVTIDPRLIYYRLPGIEGVERVAKPLSDGLMESERLGGRADVVMSSRVLAFSSGVGNDEQQEKLWRQMVRMTKVGGYGVHLMELDAFDRYVSPEIGAGRLERTFLFPDPARVYGRSSDLLVVVRRIS